MNLESLYAQVKETISGLDLNSIWPGFEVLKFALYDDAACFFDGKYIEKTDDFCANTSISFQGEQIAIWMVDGEMDIPVLTSKIVHEMFHGYQTLMGWTCWPDEMEALYRYAYKAENLSLKLRENALLLGLMDRFDELAFQELLAHRKLRSMQFPWEFLYESRVEEIEGTANYVEWQVLRQLDEGKARLLENSMRASLTTPGYLFPIRISSYFTGALMVHAMRSAGIYQFGPEDRPVMAALLEHVQPSGGDFPGKADMFRKTADAVTLFQAETESIIRSALERNETVLSGPCELLGVNIYDARCLKNFITSTYFLQVRKGSEDTVLEGNFVIRMQDEKNIETVYRWK